LASTPRGKAIFNLDVWLPNIRGFAVLPAEALNDR
jgi:hypothetical protein